MTAQATSARTRRSAKPQQKASSSSASSVVRTQRAIETLRLFQSGQTWSAEELAARFGCSTRTILRDMQLLRECGVPVEPPPGGRGFRLAHDFFWKPVRPTLEEMIALVMGCRFATDSLPEKMAQRLESAVAKVVGAAQPAVRERLNDLTLRIDAPHRAHPPRLPDNPIIPQLLLEIVHQSPLRLLVRQPSGPATVVEIVPLQLTIAEMQWHLVCMPQSGGETFNVALSWIASLESAKSSADRAAYLSDSPTGVKRPVAAPDQANSST